MKGIKALAVLIVSLAFCVAYFTVLAGSCLCAIMVMVKIANLTRHASPYLYYSASAAPLTAWAILAIWHYKRLTFSNWLQRQDRRLRTWADLPMESRLPTP